MHVRPAGESAARQAQQQVAPVPGGLLAASCPQDSPRPASTPASSLRVWPPFSVLWMVKQASTWGGREWGACRRRLDMGSSPGALPAAGLLTKRAALDPLATPHKLWRRLAATASQPASQPAPGRAPPPCPWPRRRWRPAPRTSCAPSAAAARHGQVAGSSERLCCCQLSPVHWPPRQGSARTSHTQRSRPSNAVPSMHTTQQPGAPSPSYTPPPTTKRVAPHLRLHVNGRPKEPARQLLELGRAVGRLHATQRGHGQLELVDHAAQRVAQQRAAACAAVAVRRARRLRAGRQRAGGLQAPLGPRHRARHAAGGRQHLAGAALARLPHRTVRCLALIPLLAAGRSQLALLPRRQRARSLGPLGGGCRAGAGGCPRPLAAAARCGTFQLGLLALGHPRPAADAAANSIAALGAAQPQAPLLWRHSGPARPRRGGLAAASSGAGRSSPALPCRAACGIRCTARRSSRWVNVHAGRIRRRRSLPATLERCAKRCGKGRCSHSRRHRCVIVLRPRATVGAQRHSCRGKSRRCHRRRHNC